MRKAITAIFLLSGATGLVARDGPLVKIEIVESLASERHYARNVPATEGRSATNCNNTAIGSQQGNTTVANGSSNCTTSTTPGRPARTIDETIPQVHIRIVMADGRHATLWCQSGFRHCENLTAGLYYAGIKRDAVWVRLADLSGKYYCNGSHCSPPFESR
jgi:hypothetical protein